MYLYLVHTPKTTKLLLLFLLIFKPFEWIFVECLKFTNVTWKFWIFSFPFGIIFHFSFNFLLQQFFRIFRIFRLFLSRLDMSVFFAVLVAKPHFLTSCVRFAALFDCPRVIAMSTVFIFSGFHPWCQIQIIVSTSILTKLNNWLTRFDLTDFFRDNFREFFWKKILTCFHEFCFGKTSLKIFDAFSRVFFRKKIFAIWRMLRARLYLYVQY